MSIDSLTDTVEIRRAPVMSAASPSIPRSLALETPLGGMAKRALDIMAASALLILFAPLLLCLAFLVWRQNDGPVIYRQERIGWGGKRFACLKLRSMVTNSQSLLEDYLDRNPVARLEWDTTFKLRCDPRITPLGRFLRSSSLDELPQLFNVLRGDMSIVGPRPIVAKEIEKYGTHFQDYLRGRPGLTGLWQISGRNDISYTERVKMDVRYVRDWSLWKDIEIIFRTLPAVLMERGSY
jgi:exopolysaccharide production protein ExoY